MKPLRRKKNELYHYVDGDLWGDCTDLRGNCSDLEGDCTDLDGDCTDLEGDCSDLVTALICG